jgi:predicted Zn-dependent protease
MTANAATCQIKGFAVLLALALLVSGCAAPGATHDPAARRPQAQTAAPPHGEIAYWRLAELAQAGQAMVALNSPRGVHGAVETRLLREILASGERIAAAAGEGPRPELLLTGTHGITAFAFYSDGRPSVAFSLGMVSLLGNDMDAWAALLGHELAHLRLGHHAVMKERRARTQTAGSLAGLVLSAIGVPFASVASDATAALAERAYSRDDERDADRVGLDYLRRAGFAEQGAITLHERLAAANSNAPLPFLSTHPSGEERIDNLRRMINAENAGRTSKSAPE